MDEPGAEVRGTIARLVEVGLPGLDTHLRRWAESHLTNPHEVTLALDPDGQTTSTFWLVTDHTGSEDSSSRVVFDPKSSQFGLAMQLANDVDWYMGCYGTFADSVNAM